jgi:uncharacterized membrane protein
MSDETTINQSKSWLPQLRSRWWTLLLGLSLMLNLLVGGMLFGSRFGEMRDIRLSGASYVQLIPRSFFRELSNDRRKELMKIVRDNRDDLRGLRQQYEGSSLKLAEVLEKETFSQDELRQSVLAFTTGTESLAARGGDVVIEIVVRLTPGERKLLAQAIRKRDEAGRKRRRD